MQMLNPLTVFYVGLSSRHIFYMVGVHQADIDLALFQNLKQRDSIHACRFHCHRSNLALFEPVGQFLQLNRECLETTNRLGVPIRRHRYEYLRGANVDTRGIGFDDGQTDSFFSFVRHKSLLVCPSRRPGPCKRSSLPNEIITLHSSAMSSLY